MAKKKDRPVGERASDSGQHKTKRVNVGFPEQWHALARRLAGRQRQQVLWYLLGLLIEEAKKEGLPHPPPPWDEEGSTPE